KYFSSQTRKQIEIGIQVANFANEDSSDEAGTKLVNLIQQALGRDEGWKEYYIEEMNKISTDQASIEIYNILKREYDAEKLHCMGKHQEAASTIQPLCNLFSDNPLERGWYLQQLARYTFSYNKADADTIQSSAFQNNLQLLKPRSGVNYKKISIVNESRTKKINSWIASHSTHADLMIALEGILGDLTFGMPSEKFESALHEIGDILGFTSQRPDKEIKKGPDILWGGLENRYFFFECKNEVEETRAEI